jgi:hypothetical protein
MRSKRTRERHGEGEGRVEVAYRAAGDQGGRLARPVPEFVEMVGEWGPETRLVACELHITFEWPETDIVLFSQTEQCSDSEMAAPRHPPGLPRLNCNNDDGIAGMTNLAHLMHHCPAVRLTVQ